jgi:uncharacterized membrane protein YphA (DoxX/SURF4 family)
MPAPGGTPGPACSKNSLWANERIRTMPNLRRKTAADESTKNLPLRWVVILAVAAGAGVAVGCLTTVAAGVTVSVGLATFLHKAMD